MLTYYFLIFCAFHPVDDLRAEIPYSRLLAKIQTTQKTVSIIVKESIVIILPNKPVASSLILFSYRMTFYIEISS